MNDNQTPTFWQMSEERLLALLRRVEAGESADDVYMQEYIHADITHIDGQNDDA